jgi:23S rRNA pseudouridine1911/1915/1917 synthase
MSQVSTEIINPEKTLSFRFTVVDEAEDYLVVDKPPLLLTHPTKPSRQPTLWKELHDLLAFEIANGGQISIINRLDRETSGLVLIAKTAAAARQFGLLMQQRRLQKEYLAIVWDWPTWETKLVDAPLDRQGKHRHSAIWLKRTIHPAGAPAQTEFSVERRFVRSTTGARHGALCPLPPRGDSEAEELPQVRGYNSNSRLKKFAVVRAKPRTGRTHQIRVHLASIGHPIVGDKIYGSNEKLYLEFIQTGWTARLQRELLLPRHALHSTKLVIQDEHEWTSVLPVDLASFCSRPALPAEP